MLMIIIFPTMSILIIIRRLILMTRNCVISCGKFNSFDFNFSTSRLWPFTLLDGNFDIYKKSILIFFDNSYGIRKRRDIFILWVGLWLVVETRIIARFELLGRLDRFGISNHPKANLFARMDKSSATLLNLDSWWHHCSAFGRGWANRTPWYKIPLRSIVITSWFSPDSTSSTTKQVNFQIFASLQNEANKNICSSQTEAMNKVSVIIIELLCCIVHANYEYLELYRNHRAVSRGEG